MLVPIHSALKEWQDVLSFLTLDEGEDIEELRRIRDDEAGEYCEVMTGVGFVIAQASVSSLCGRLKVLHTLQGKRHPGKQISVTNGTKREMMRFGEASTQFSRVEVVNALANYFKHEDEWLGPWDHLRGQARDTVEIVRATGGVEYSTGNLRVGAKWLGVEKDIRLLSRIVQLWRTALVTAYDEECKRLGL